MHIRNRIRSVVAMAAAVMMVLPGVALADDISNNLDATVDADLELMSLTASGANGTTTLRVIPQNDDGKNGCNFGGTTGTLVTGVSSSNTAVATVSPSSITWSSCGQTPVLTVTPVGEGTATISLSQTSNGTGATFSLAPAAFRVNVGPAPVTNVAPTVTPVITGGTPGDNGWFTGGIVSLSWTITGTPTPTVDAGKDCSAKSIHADGVHSFTCAVMNDAGSASDTATIKYDATVPSITNTGVQSGTAGTNGWYTSAIAHRFTASDATSGLAGPAQIDVGTGSQEGSDVKVNSGAVSDNAGNENPGIDSPLYGIDLSNPYDIDFVGGPAANSTHYFGSVPAAPTCTAKDDVSDIASCVVSGYSNDTGSHTLTATATDNAGRTATATRTYEVLPWDFKGFYSPVNNNAINTIKSGQTVPLKFNVSGASNFTDISVVKSFQVKSVNCATLDGSVDPVDMTTTGNTSLRYDATEGQFIQNWKTPTGAGCYKVLLTLQDGQVKTLDFQTRK